MLYSHFDTLTPAVFYARKISIFEDSFCCSCFAGFDTTTFRGVLRSPSSIYNRDFCLISQTFLGVNYFTAQKMKLSIKDFFSNCGFGHIYWNFRKLRIWSHLLKKPLMENFISFVKSFHRTLNFDIWQGSVCTSEYIYSRILLAY